MSEGQCSGDQCLDEYGVGADGQGTHGGTPSGSRHGRGRDLAGDGRAGRWFGGSYSATGWGATAVPEAATHGRDVRPQGRKRRNVRGEVRRLTAESRSASEGQVGGTDA